VGVDVRAHEVDLITLVQGTKQFEVPLYQRPYSWQEDQLRQLWADILTEAERMKDGELGSGHFIGSVVLAPSPTAQSAGGLARWLVVDGQQRLTTLMIALAAIRDHVATVEPETVERIAEEYLVNRFRKGDERLRLLPTQADRDAFRACILRLAGADAGDGVGAAYRFFRAGLVAFDDPEDPHDVARVEEVIRQRLRIVEITAERGDNVHRIFESLNNTGLKLSQADLLRNHLFMLLPARAEETYHDIWLPMQRSLGSQLELLMWLDLLLRGDDKAKQDEVFRAQVERLRPVEHDEDAVVAEIVEFARRARLLQLILNPEREKDNAVRAALSRLAAWGGQISYPTATLLLDRRDRGLLGSDGVARGLGLVESFLVRRMLAGIPTNNLNRILNAVPRETGSAEDVVGALHQYLSGTRRYWPTDAAIREAVRTKPFYWSGRGPQRTFVLRRLEESYASPEPVDWRAAKVTVEHVMPQSLTDAWKEHLAQEAAAAGMSEAELHESVVHTLGNLTLTAENERLSNHPFTRKQEILTRSGLVMNREIAATARWGKTEIDARAGRLADRIIRLWPGPVGRGDDSDASRDWTQLHQALALMPAGSWTTYGDLAELIGSHPVAVGGHLATKPAPNAWRVLTSDGHSSKQFRWLYDTRSGSQRDALVAEGVPFDAWGRAGQERRLTAVDLARLMGFDVADELPGAPSDEPVSDRHQRFLTQLDDSQDHNTAEGVRALLDRWRRAGGSLSFGAAEETSCFTTLHGPAWSNHGIWPLAIYPRYGGAEVVFQHLARRPPFDDPALRRELRDRLNSVDGIDLPESKLALRPSFPLTVLSTTTAVEQISGILEWFALTCLAPETDPAWAADPNGVEHTERRAD
jgi:alkylated DNA nucleotide flippase Atl1